MPIEIYTYRDPYKLDAEPYWDEIKSCPYFCASQTLVNGLKNLYKKDFQQGRVTTVQNFIESLFDYWESTVCIVKQHTDIDNIIANALSPVLGETMQENIARAFLFNREEVFQSIRVMFELNMNVQDIIMDKLTPEQTFIVEVFKKILSSEKKKDFILISDFDEASIDETLKKTMAKARNDFDPFPVHMDRIVIHGVHQFSPIMLRAIEKLSEYKKVILLFNYQTQYKNAYQTWIDIYNAFDCQIINFDGTEFRPSLQYPASYKGNVLADNLGKLIDGRTDDIVYDTSYEIIEFDNMTEFASYVADLFEAAEKADPANPMSSMREQIYAADSSANDILKIYFPEQFGERQFLDYPLGHFFIAIASMWDYSSNEILITDINDIKECLEAGILKEEYLGQLATIFGSTSALFEGCTSIDEMVSRLKKLKKNQKHLTDQTKKEYVSHISYYSATKEDLSKLEQALTDLDELAAYFYEDFENQSHNFREFYKRLKNYLQDDILDARDLDEEFTDIIRRVLERLKEVENIDASASFECLKATMSIYLVQETKPGKSANWIVRNFEQIDGDIMRRSDEKVVNDAIIYHFACLSDEDINSVKKAVFSWPLDDNFFEVAQEPVDWKYQVFVKARKEYKNFKRYALLYGLEFNRAKFKLSYVKRDGDKERDPYYLLKILGVKKMPYEETRIGRFLADVSDIAVSGSATGLYTEYDYFRYRICKYRFLLESIVEGTTVYKDNFLLVKYLEVLLENQVKEDLQGLPISEIVLIEKLNDAFDELKKYFPFILNVNRMDVINNIRNRMLDNMTKAFPILSGEQRQYMMIRELFIHKQLADPKTFRKNILQDKFPAITDEKMADELSDEVLQKLKFRKNVDLWCQYCSNRELCAAYFARSDS
ncbi:hypothetical protein [Papillibacter cinnamivorans]|uniref:PD-(D/E)XK nuclease superfamily protein n=1 Tax=Papillibacter cinnamivorans DSM 12816 TaxID=1122930 RepID=A0A1W2AMV3_9FIRM|nr:hypothetical protein [Papillibacter cinnamivorans]SMC62027.1 hypothetical protein SAMN02745168_1848 [Papillibacter cinnamivorans DSM 12816]